METRLYVYYGVAIQPNTTQCSPIADCSVFVTADTVHSFQPARLVTLYRHDELR